MAYNIEKYWLDDGTCPFDNWLLGLRDKRAKARILVRLTRLELGLFGDHKSLGNGVYELRIREGKGYRVYYAIDGETVVLLLTGGSKATQSNDIALAKTYWQQHQDEG